MEELNPNQITQLMLRFPKFELSYETVSHRKVSLEEYPICLNIPYGKKGYLWFTFFQDKNVCLYLELSREKKIVKVFVFPNFIPTKLALDTLFYGTIYDHKENDTIIKSFFIIEDILYSFGIALYKQVLSEKLGFVHCIFNMFQDVFQNLTLPCYLPQMFKHNDAKYNVKTVPYNVHHLQYRSLTKILPYINSVLQINPLDAVLNKTEQSFSDLFIPPPLPKFDFAKPQFTQSTIFETKADLQNDIYHLYAFGKSSERVYCGIAYIPNYKTSVMMNSVFRKIKENQNLDSLEESDDEDDFQDISFDKYVDLKKTAIIKYTYLAKFRRWAPINVIYSKQQGQVVHISKLVGYTHH